MQFNSRKEVIDYGSANAKMDSQYDTVETKIAIIPFRDTGTSAFRRVAAYIERIESVSGEKAHTMILAFDGSLWYHWCADSFLAGKYKAAERNEALKVAKDGAETAAMRDLYGKYKDTGCGFWKSGGERCKHTDHMHASITDDILDQLEALFHGSTAATGRKRRTPKEFIEKRMFKKHVKLEGPKGSGKTHLAWVVAQEHADVIIPVAGSEKVDSAQLEGHLVPYAERVKTKGQGGLFESNEQVIQTFVFKYGALARAFRAAAAGKKTVVILDEMFRIPPEQMQLLVTALSPVNGHYVLPVSNMVESDHDWEDGLVEEVLRAPVENLMVIGTTNVGSQYIVDGIDEALEDRFHTEEVPEDRELTEMVIGQSLAAHGYAPHNKAKLMAFFDGMRRTLLDKKLEREINMRHLLEIIDVAVNEDDFAETAYEMRTQWASRTVDGTRDPLQVRMIEKLIEQTLE